MEWVFDASVTMAWCFDDERSPETDALFDRVAAGSPAVVPQIWPLEVANVLTLVVRKGRINQTQRRQFLAILESAAISIDVLPAKPIFSDVLQLAEKHRLTAYDASYLELAMRLGLPLATLDAALVKAARATGVRLL